MLTPGRVGERCVRRCSPTRARSSGSLTPRPSRRRDAQDADLALVTVVVDLVGGLADLLEREDRRQRRHDLAVDDRLVGRPRLAVVREVRALDGLELHPQVPVVVLDHVAARRRAGDDRAAALGHEDARAHRGAARVLEDDVGVVADQGADVLAEPAPLATRPGCARPSRTGSPSPRGRSRARSPARAGCRPCLRSRHDADRRAARVEHVLDGEGADAARRAPDQDLVALGDRRAVARDQHAVRGRVAQRVDRRLLPRQVRRAWASAGWP